MKQEMNLTLICKFGIYSYFLPTHLPQLTNMHFSEFLRHSVMVYVHTRGQFSLSSKVIQVIYTFALSLCTNNHGVNVEYDFLMRIFFGINSISHIPEGIINQRTSHSMILCLYLKVQSWLYKKLLLRMYIYKNSNSHRYAFRKRGKMRKFGDPSAES